jgi:hypothetical protein
LNTGERVLDRYRGERCVEYLVEQHISGVELVEEEKKKGKSA